MKKQAITILTSFILSFILIPSADAGFTLEAIKERGYINCGTNTSITALIRKLKNGNLKGMDVSFCKALSAGIFGTTENVKFINIKNNGIKLLKNGKIDILLGSTRWSASIDLDEEISFAGLYYISSQGILAHYKKTARSLKAYQNKNICVANNNDAIEKINDFNKKYALNLRIMPFIPSKAKEMFFVNRCDLYSNDILVLRSKSMRRFPKELEIVLLPETVSENPTGPIVRTIDNQWFDIVRWVLNAIIKAEELGVSSKNVTKLLNSKRSEIKYLLGIEGKLGQKLKLDDKWAYRIIKQVGNYKEIFERNIGIKSSLKLNRNKNDLWNKEGILWSPSFY